MKLAVFAAPATNTGLVEPPLNPAIWNGEAGASVLLTSGEYRTSAVDHRVPGRSMGFAFERNYRSGTAGYGPLGAAGWSSPYMAHIREIPVDYEREDPTNPSSRLVPKSLLVEYHVGDGRVFRFISAGQNNACPSGYQIDPVMSLCAPHGLYLRPQKLTTGGYRLIGPARDALLFDARGRLVEISDRHRQLGAKEKKGSTLTLRHDAYGQLIGIEDELGRYYRLSYEMEPSVPRYGLLKELVDLSGRTVTYEFDTKRRLEAVALPAVTNTASGYVGAYDYTGSSRPTIRYRYTTQVFAVTAPLHGEFSPLRLAGMSLPSFLPGQPERLRVVYDTATARVATLSVPDPANRNGDGTSEGLKTSFTYGPAGTPVATLVTVDAPWTTRQRYELLDGHIAAVQDDEDVP
ncbi:MAG: hypothetical protein JNK60_20960, partial [Acidobacteria bacterium]|nr:hypothetical protein [Acidobacteriota bacterium]